MWWQRFGGYLGATIGILGWLIGFTLFCLLTGNTAALGEFFYLGFVISLSMAATFILVLECLIRLYGAHHRLFYLTVYGLTLFFCGLLILLLNHWIAPIIERYPEMVADIHRSGSFYRVSDVYPFLSLSAGLVLLSLATLQLLCDSPSHRRRKLFLTRFFWRTRHPRRDRLIL